MACEQAPATTNTKLRSTCGRPASLAVCGIAHLWRGWADRSVVYCSDLSSCAFFVRYRLFDCVGRIPPSPLRKTYKKLSLNLVGFFVPKKLHQKCTNPVSTHFYGHFSNCRYPIHPIPLSHSTRQHKMCGVIFLPFQSKRCTKKRLTKKCIRAFGQPHLSIFNSRYWGYTQWKIVEKQFCLQIFTYFCAEV